MIRLKQSRHLADASLDGLNAAYPNAGFIGLPLCLLAFGHASLATAVIAMILTVCVLFAVAIVLIELGLQTEKKFAATLGKVVRPLVTPIRCCLRHSRAGYVAERGSLSRAARTRFSNCWARRRVPVMDRRKGAGDDRRNGASWKWCETRIRTASKMRFFTGICNGVFAIRKHWFRLAEALALNDDAVSTMA